MSIKGLEAQRNYPLNKKLKEIFWGSWCMQTNWNYERQMNTAFMYGMSKTIDRLYPDPDEIDKKKEAYQRHLEFFNITPQCASLVYGICIAMEEEYAEHPDTFDPGAINAVKVALMGPLSGIGDSLFQGTIRIIAMSIGISLAQQGSIVHRLINSPVAVQQVQEVLDIHSELQGIALAPYIEEEILIELQIQLMMPGHDGSSAFGILAFTAFQITVLINVSPEIIALLLGRISHLTRLAVSIIGKVPLIQRLAGCRNVQQVV